ncbi:hypothetical protein ACFL6P_02310 [Candidatus Latescibacterota bacterium]
MMKFLLRIFMAVSALLFTLVTVIKIVQGCSYKEAVGIAEELYAEIKDSCGRCCERACHSDDEEDDDETQEDK